MTKRNTRNSFLSPMQLFAMAAGALLYAALTIPFNTLPIPDSGGLVALRPTVAIPMLFGIIFGPFTGLVSGLVGNVVSDYVSFSGTSWNWDIASGLLGAIPGVAYLVISRADWTKRKTIAHIAALAILASFAGAGFGALIDYFYQVNAGPNNTALLSFASVGLTDAINGAILTPTLLFSYAKATFGRARRL
ncbi:MAG TPA: ECF transporter S component [Terriglobales bacterium]|nr:ECF transporter S component [Terriglobales bacterium]